MAAVAAVTAAAVAAIGIYFVAYIATRGKVTTEFSFQTHGRNKKKSPNPTPTVTRQVTTNHVRARMVVVSGQGHRRMQARAKKRAAAVALGKMSKSHRPSQVWKQMWYFSSEPTKQEWAQRVAADELECKNLHHHRMGEKIVVGACFCSRCRSMCPKMNCCVGHGLACEEALRCKRPRLYGVVSL